MHGDVAPDGDRGIGGELLDGELRAEIMGDRIEAAGVHEASSRGQRRGVMAQVGLVHELGLPAQVEVVRARRCACRHHRVTMLRIGTHGGHEHPSGLGQALKPSGICGIDRAEGDLTRESRGHLVELRLVPARQRDAGRRRCARHQALGDQSAGEPGRTQQDDVNLS